MSEAYQMNFNESLDLEEVLGQAVAVGGQLGDEDRISGVFDSWPIYSVVGKGSKDSERYDERIEANVSLAGHFRFKTPTDEIDYRKSLHPLVILDVRVPQAAWLHDEVICRGISTEGLYKPRAISGKFVRPGFDCTKCPLWRFREGATHPLTGEPVRDEEKCKSSFHVYAWDPQNDPKGEKPIIIRFSASSISAWKEWAKKVEARDAKIWSLWVGLKTKHNPGEKGRSDYYTPEIKVGGVLTAEQFAIAETLRATVGGKLAVREEAALPAGAVPQALPEGVLTPEIVSPDPFISE